MLSSKFFLANCPISVVKGLILKEGQNMFSGKVKTLKTSATSI